MSKAKEGEEKRKNIQAARLRFFTESGVFLRHYSILDAVLLNYWEPE